MTKKTTKKQATRKAKQKNPAKQTQKKKRSSKSTQSTTQNHLSQSILWELASSFHTTNKTASQKLERLWPQYQFRPQQERTAQAVHQALNDEEILLAEAGTGSGKTIAYLLPLFVFAEKNNKRVVISTETKSLQQQIFAKDLKTAEQLLGVKIPAEICFGAGNFVCKRRLQETIMNGSSIDPYMSTHLEQFLSWESKSSTGLRQEYDGPLSNSFWEKIRREPLDCLGSRCPSFSISPYFVARRRWQDARILIVNHSLLASHFFLDSKLLPEFTSLVIDEAHHFPEIFQKTFTLNGSLRECESLLREEKDNKETLKILEQFQRELLAAVFTTERNRERIQTELSLQSGFHLLSILEKLEDDIRRKLEQETNLEESQLKLHSELAIAKSLAQLQLQARLTRFQKFRILIEKLLAQKEVDGIVWVERIQTKGHKELKIFCAPLSAGKLIRERVIEPLSSVVFTSATLTASSSRPFEYFRKEIGFETEEQEEGDVRSEHAEESLEHDFSVNRTHCIKIASSFDYRKQCLVYVSKEVGDPSASDDIYHQGLATEIRRLLELSGGGAFVLFTSSRSLQKVHLLLAKDSSTSINKRYTLLSQVELGPDKALRAFRKDRSAVILGLATFWQGIDIPGEQLRMVIVTRIPFRVPDEPILAGRIDLEKDSGRNPFYTIQLPQAVLSLRQGFGRLIRSSEDRGVIALLDPRLQSRAYGKEILKMLPPTKHYHSFHELSKAAQELLQMSSSI